MGGERVLGILTDPESTPYAHALNVAEVYRIVLRAIDEAAAEDAVGILQTDGVQIREDLDTEIWKRAQKLREQHPMALPDAIGLSLAYRINADFVTADRAELEPVEKAETSLITFIRPERPGEV